MAEQAVATEDFGDMLAEAEAPFVPSTSASAPASGPDVAVLQAEIAAEKAKNSALESRQLETRQYADRVSQEAAFARQQTAAAQQQVAQAQAYANQPQSQPNPYVPFDQDRFLERPEEGLNQFAKAVSDEVDQRFARENLPALRQELALGRQELDATRKTLHGNAVQQSRGWYAQMNWPEDDFNEDYAGLADQLSKAGQTPDGLMRDFGALKSGLMLFRMEKNRPTGRIATVQKPPATAGNGEGKQRTGSKPRITKRAAAALQRLGLDPNDVDPSDPKTKALLGKAGGLTHV